MRWSDSRRRASRTAAYAAKSRSSSGSSFPSRSRNSTVLARSSLSESSRNCGSSEVMYAACSARRFIRLPSPKRSAFSRVPPTWAMQHRVPAVARGTNRGLTRLRSSVTALERRLVDLPEVAVDPAGPHDVLRALERRHAAEGALAVDEQCPLALVRGEPELRAADAGQLDDLDPAAGDRPEGVLAPDRFGPVRRVELSLERLTPFAEALGAFLDDEVA